MRKTLSRARLRSKLDDTVNKLLKKYEPRHASARNLFALLDSKSANNELIYTNKFRTPKKIIIAASKLPMIFPAEPEQKIVKFSNKDREKHLKTISPNHSKPLFSTEIEINPRHVIRYSNSRVDRLIRMSESPIMTRYKDLIRSCSTILPNKDFAFEQEERRIKKIQKRIKNIIEDPEENAE
jgi:hypothetical protein